MSISEARPVLMRNKAIVERNQRTSQEGLMRFFTLLPGILNNVFCIYTWRERDKWKISYEILDHFFLESAPHFLWCPGSILWSVMLKVLISPEKSIESIKPPKVAATRNVSFCPSRSVCPSKGVSNLQHLLASPSNISFLHWQWPWIRPNLIF